MRTKLVLIAGNCLLTFLPYPSCQKDPLNPRGAPSMKTHPATISDATHVTLKGEVNDDYRLNEFGPGIFTHEIHIVQDTTYYVRSYAINSIGIKYGNQLNFTTNPGLPEVLNKPVTNIDTTTNDGTGSTAFSSAIAGLTKGTTYYLRA